MYVTLSPTKKIFPWSGALISRSIIMPYEYDNKFIKYTAKSNIYCLENYWYIPIVLAYHTLISLNQIICLIDKIYERVKHTHIFSCHKLLINIRWCYNCYKLHVHHKISITKLWALSSYFLYVYMVLLQHCFPFITTLFYLNIQFSMLFSCIKLWYKHFKLIELSTQLNII